MKRADIYRVHRPTDDPKRHRCFIVVSRQELIDSGFSTVVCAPIFTRGQGLTSQLSVGPDEGMKHQSWIMCDNLVSVRKSELIQFVGALPYRRRTELDECLRIALALD